MYGTTPSIVQRLENPVNPAQSNVSPEGKSTAEPPLVGGREGCSANAVRCGPLQRDSRVGQAKSRRPSAAALRRQSELFMILLNEFRRLVGRGESGAGIFRSPSSARAGRVSIVGGWPASTEDFEGLEFTVDDFLSFS